MLLWFGYILKVMIGHAYGYDMIDLVQSADDIDLALHRIGLDDRHDLAVRQHSMDLDSIHGRDLGGD